MKNFTKKHKAPLFVMLTLFLVYLLIVGLTHLVAQERINDHLELERERTRTQIEASISRYEAFSNYLRNSLVTHEVLMLISEANSSDEQAKNQAREDLKTLLKDNYELLQEYNFRQINFHLPTGETFLRLNALEVHGDMVFDLRESIRIANTDHVYVSGFEQGRIYNGYRFVYPLFLDESHVGSVEISVSYEAVLDTLYTVNPNEDAFFIIKESLVSDTVDDAYVRHYTRSSLSDTYLRDTEVFAAFRYQRHHFQGLQLEEFFARIKPEIKDGLDGENSFSHVTDCDECHYVLHFISVKNIEGEHAGYLFTIINDEHYSDLIRENRINIALISWFFLMLFTFMGVATKSRAKLKKLSREDPLTNLDNRLFFAAQVETLLNQAKRNGFALSLIMIDIDDFKEVNDTFGHQEGDRVLKELASTFIQTLRESDIIGRWGGEEFLIALPNTFASDAKHVAEKLRKITRKNVSSKDGAPITISLGVASYLEEDTSFDALLFKADDALYKAKNRGKDQVFVYDNQKDAH